MLKLEHIYAAVINDTIILHNLNLFLYLLVFVEKKYITNWVFSILFSLQLIEQLFR